MKLSKSQLKRIIQEELQKVLMREQSGDLPIYKLMDHPEFEPSMLPQGMRINWDSIPQYIEDASTRKNPQIQAVKRMLDQISSCQPMSVPYGGKRMEVGAKRQYDKAKGPVYNVDRWTHGASDPRHRPAGVVTRYGRPTSHNEEIFEDILQGVKLENYPAAIEAAYGIQEGLPTECQQLGANLLQLLGSFIAPGGGLSGESGEGFRPKESEVPTDPRHSR